MADCKIQLNPEELSAIVRVAVAAKSFLVFGMGYDSRLWEQCCRHVVLVEDDPVWLNAIKLTLPPSARILRTSYQTTVENWAAEIAQVPEFQDYDYLSTAYGRFEAVLVDGPKGYKPEHPGRLQSISCGAMLCSKHLFIHDIDRPLEQAALKRFCNGFRLAGIIGRLAHLIADSPSSKPGNAES